MFHILKISSIKFNCKLNNISIKSIKSFIWFDLGITFEPQLYFNSHIESITKK